MRGSSLASDDGSGDGDGVDGAAAGNTDHPETESMHLDATDGSANDLGTAADELSTGVAAATVDMASSHASAGPPPADEAEDEAEVEGAQGVRQWLTKAGLGSYSDVVIENGYDELSLFDDPSDFGDAGITDLISELMDEEQQARDGPGLRAAILDRQQKSSRVL